MEDTEAFAECRETIEHLRGLLVPSLPPYKPGAGEKLLRLSLVWREALFHRVVDLASAAFEMFSAERLVPGCTLTRALFETVANLHFLHKKMVEAIETKKLEKLHDCVVRGAWGDKDGSLKIETALQVLTSIKHLDKEFQFIEREYFHLCEYAHPNMKGGMGTYSKITLKDYSVMFGTNPQDLEMDPFGLGDLSLILSIAKILHERLRAVEGELFEVVRANAKGIFRD